MLIRAAIRGQLDPASLPLREAWIEINISGIHISFIRVASLAGSVD